MSIQVRGRPDQYEFIVDSVPHDLSRKTLACNDFCDGAAQPAEHVVLFDRDDDT